MGETITVATILGHITTAVTSAASWLTSGADSVTAESNGKNCKCHRT